MLSAYTPTLKKPSEQSADWYKNFHNIFYLSQLTNLTLLSYMDSLIGRDKSEMKSELRDTLIQKKIMRHDKENNIDFIVKKSEFNSIHVEDILNGVVANVILNNNAEIKTLLMGMMLQSQDNNDKELEVNLSELLDTTSSKNWYELLRELLNVWEFLFLYGIVESTFKNILNKTGLVKEEDLIPSIFEHFGGLEKCIGISETNFVNLWNFYTELRNIYAHGHGLITSKAKCNLGGKLNKARESLYEVCGGITLTNIDGIFKKELIKKEKFYFLKDDELNIFRNLIIRIMETIDSEIISNAKES